MKQIQFARITIVALLSTLITSLSCSNDEGNSEIKKDPINSNTEATADTLPDNVTDSVPENVFYIEKEGIVMYFALLNLQGIPAVTFSEGEEIIFDLKIKNTTDTIISHPGGPNTLGYNTFRVFTNDGEDYGVSWTYTDKWYKNMPYFYPQTTYHYQCPWYSDDVVKASYPFIFKSSSNKLAKGGYYTEAYCHFGQETILSCKINFDIK